MAAKQFKAHKGISSSVPSRSNPRASALAASSVQIPAQTVRLTILRLKRARSVAITAAMALTYQSADADLDVAVALRHCVADPLTGEISLLHATLGDGAEED